MATTFINGKRVETPNNVTREDVIKLSKRRFRPGTRCVIKTTYKGGNQKLKPGQRYNVKNGDKFKIGPDRVKACSPDTIVKNKSNQSTESVTEYVPTPIDTYGVEIPDGLNNLVEILSANTHEIWASLRSDEGWKYGPIKDSTKKSTPCMVPYFQLSDNEKIVDRDIVVALIKTIIKLGYDITYKKASLPAETKNNI